MTFWTLPMHMLELSHPSPLCRGLLKIALLSSRTLDSSGWLQHKLASPNRDVIVVRCEARCALSTSPINAFHQWWFCDFNHRLPLVLVFLILSSSHIPAASLLISPIFSFPPLQICKFVHKFVLLLLPLARLARLSAPLWAGLGLWDARIVLGAINVRPGFFAEVKK